ncbi:MAG: hypothetical protein AABZ39_12140 [Spirochaetota bacterium]
MKNILLLVLPFSLCAQTFNITNITVPAYERYLLRDLNGGQTMALEINSVNDKRFGPSWSVNAVTTFPEMKNEASMIIRHADLQVVSAAETRTFKDGTVRETFELKSLTATNDDKGFLVSNPQSIGYIMRTFPFTSGERQITLRFLGSRGGGMSFYVKNNGLKRIDLKTLGRIDAYELELGVDASLLSAFIPKTFYYFRNDVQKTFVRFKGSFMPGAKENDLELVEYTNR